MSIISLYNENQRLLRMLQTARRQHKFLTQTFVQNVSMLPEPLNVTIQKNTSGQSSPFDNIVPGEKIARKESYDGKFILHMLLTTFLTLVAIAKQKPAT